MSNDDAISLFCSGGVYTLVPDADQVAENLEVPLFDCGAITENPLYAINQVLQGLITPDELEITQTNLILYSEHFQKNSIQQNVENNINVRSETVDLTTTAVLTTPLLALLVTR